MQHIIPHINFFLFFVKREKRGKLREKKINEANCWRQLQRFFYQAIEIFRPRHENVPVKEKKFDRFF